MTVVQSDWTRAGLALAVTLGGAIGLVSIQESRAAAATADATPSPVVYSILNMTERMADRRACPLDLDVARSTLESDYAALPVTLEYSPLADGPEVLLHEISATAVVEAGSAIHCAWTIRVTYQGETAVHEIRTLADEAPPALAHPDVRRDRLSALPAR